MCLMKGTTEISLSPARLSKKSTPATRVSLVSLFKKMFTSLGFLVFSLWTAASGGANPRAMGQRVLPEFKVRITLPLYKVVQQKSGFPGLSLWTTASGGANPRAMGQRVLPE